MLDPFLPENPEHVARLKAIQEDIHATFIDLVKSRRGARLTAPEDELFSGEYWAAQKGIEYGLVDRIGDLRSVMRERYGDKVETPLVSAPRGLFGRTTPGIERRSAARPRPCRRSRLGAGSARDLGALRTCDGTGEECDAASDPLGTRRGRRRGRGRWLYRESQRINAELHPEPPVEERAGAQARARSGDRRLSAEVRVAVTSPA